MRSMQFLKLSLLSQRERCALQIDLTSQKTVLVAGNGFGKSAILKSLYECLGAQPHKIDKSWQDARVTSLLEFTIDGNAYVALKIGGNFTVFDSGKNALINTSRVTAEFGPFLADLLNFKLVLADKQDNIRVPPPSYAFAPFYVDQDRGWQKAWDSFKDLVMFSGSAKSLSEYHSGLRPNAYYEAKAERDRIKADLGEIASERQAVDQALRRVRETMPAMPLIVDLDRFKEETDRLIAEAQVLHNEEAKFRIELAVLNEEQQVWGDHVALLEAAIAELDMTFNASLEHPADVECPMCGQHYENHIADQFELAADKDDLFIALQIGRTSHRGAKEKVMAHKEKIGGILDAIMRINRTLAVRKEDISLRDVVAAEGRIEAQRFLEERLVTLDSDYADKERALKDCERRMREVDSANRKTSIRAYFADKLEDAAQALDVRLPAPTASSLQGVNIGRGSEGPRALAAYYYAFLHTTGKHGSSVFCPIVVDAPNQQGQDKDHLESILKFLLSDAPPESQIIIGTEAMTVDADVNIIDVTWKKDQVLREGDYEQVAAYLSPFLEQSIL